MVDDRHREMISIEDHHLLELDLNKAMSWGPCTCVLLQPLNHMTRGRRGTLEIPDRTKVAGRRLKGRKRRDKLAVQSTHNEPYRPLLVFRYSSHVYMRAYVHKKGTKKKEKSHPHSRAS